MPFVSKAQAAWGNSPAGKKALGGESSVKEWNDATDFSSLPNKIKKENSQRRIKKPSKDIKIKHPGVLSKVITQHRIKKSDNGSW